MRADQLVENMVKIQASNGRPLTAEQVAILTTHMHRMYTSPHTQQDLTQHAAALLRSFTSGTPLPPLPGAWGGQAVGCAPLLRVRLKCMYGRTVLRAALAALTARSPTTFIPHPSFDCRLRQRAHSPILRMHPTRP